MRPGQWGLSLRARTALRPMRPAGTAALLRADLTNHHHHLRAVSEEEVERRMRKRYPGAVVILTRLEESWRQDPTASEISRHG